MAKKYDVFISYAAQDKPRAREIAKALSDRGEKVWFDELELKAGDQWDVQIEKSLAASKTVLLLLSDSSLRSQWTNYEMGLALGHAADSGQRVVPVLLDDVDPSTLPAPIRNRSFLKLSGSERSLDRLVEQVVGDGSRGSKEPG